MRKSLRALSVLAAMSVASGAQAGDQAAGKAKAEACAACHGANGVSVSGDIPNLAGQKEKYIAGQLKAFRAEKRKNGIMNPIAAQLSDQDIEDLAAFWSSLPGATGSAKSALVEAIEKSRATFPADYKKTFTDYRTRNLAAKKQVRRSYASPAAVKAAREGVPLPPGSMVLIEVYKAKLDAAKNPIKGDDGFYIAGDLAFYTAMRTEPGWGNDIPELYRNGDWNYAVFTADQKMKAGFNQAKCLACHKPFASDSYLFTLKQLQTVARKN
ncbi:MAG: cytochrome P460 family protein [Hyphomicrobiales bacterium]|nr:cytochrome P460 family protein [Hyphomicrobiales bacterium]